MRGLTPPNFQFDHNFPFVPLPINRIIFFFTNFGDSPMLKRGIIGFVIRQCDKKPFAPGCIHQVNKLRGVFVGFQ